MDNFDYIKYLKNNPLLNEIKINNPNNITPQQISDLWYEIENNLQIDLNEFNKICEEYFYGSLDLDIAEELTQEERNKLYKELKKLKNGNI